MAGLGEVTITLTNDIAVAIEKVGEELKAAQEALSEACIRSIVREELAAWEKRQVQVHRFGLPANMETK